MSQKLLLDQSINYDVVYAFHKFHIVAFRNLATIGRVKVVQEGKEFFLDDGYSDCAIIGSYDSEKVANFELYKILKIRENPLNYFKFADGADGYSQDELPDLLKLIEAKDEKQIEMKEEAVTTEEKSDQEEIPEEETDAPAQEKKSEEAPAKDNKEEKTARKEEENKNPAKAVAAGGIFGLGGLFAAKKEEEAKKKAEEEAKKKAEEVAKAKAEAEKKAAEEKAKAEAEKKAAEEKAKAEAEARKKAEEEAKAKAEAEARKKAEELAKAKAEAEAKKKAEEEAKAKAEAEAKKKAEEEAKKKALEELAKKAEVVKNSVKEVTDAKVEAQKVVERNAEAEAKAKAKAEAEKKAAEEKAKAEEEVRKKAEEEAKKALMSMPLNEFIDQKVKEKEPKENEILFVEVEREDAKKVDNSYEAILTGIMDKHRLRVLFTYQKDENGLLTSYGVFKGLYVKPRERDVLASGLTKSCKAAFKNMRITIEEDKVPEFINLLEEIYTKNASNN